MLIQDFEVEIAQADLDIDSLDANFEEAFAQIWRGDAENDGFNRLILTAGLSWRQVAMLRGYCKYLLQIGVPFSQTYVEAHARPLSAAGAPAGGTVRGAGSIRAPATRARPRSRPGMERFARAAASALANGDDAALAVLKPVIDARAGKRDAQVEATAHGAQGRCSTASPASTRTASCAASSA